MLFDGPGLWAAHAVPRGIDAAGARQIGPLGAIGERGVELGRGARLSDCPLSLDTDPCELHCGVPHRPVIAGPHHQREEDTPAVRTTGPTARDPQRQYTVLNAKLVDRSGPRWRGCCPHHHRNHCASNFCVIPRVPNSKFPLRHTAADGAGMIGPGPSASHTPTESSGGWFVIWTESRAEKKVEQRIAALGLSPWLPIIKERRRWSDRWRVIDCPLFPGYLFARATIADWSTLLRIPGVLTVITEHGKPALLADSFITSLRDAISREGVLPEAVSDDISYAPGDEVIVQEGVLRGVRGVVRERRSGRQLVLWVAEIGRGVAFTIGSALVRAASTK